MNERTVANAAVINQSDDSVRCTALNACSACSSAPSQRQNNIIVSDQLRGRKRRDQMDGHSVKKREDEDWD